MTEPGYTIEERRDHVRVQRDPGYTVRLDDQLKILRELAEACDRVGCRKVLIVGQGVRVELSTFDLFELGNELARLNLQVAVIESHDAPTRSAEFLETVTHNRSAPLRFFDSEEAATKWLEVN